MNDPFRKQYRTLTEPEKDRIERIKDLAAKLHAELTADPVVPNSGAREMALARTKLEECVMWGTKAISG